MSESKTFDNLEAIYPIARDSDMLEAINMPATASLRLKPTGELEDAPSTPRPSPTNSRPRPSP